MSDILRDRLAQIIEAARNEPGGLREMSNVKLADYIVDKLRSQATIGESTLFTDLELHSMDTNPIRVVKDSHHRPINEVAGKLFLQRKPFQIYKIHTDVIHIVHTEVDREYTGRD